MSISKLLKPGDLEKIFAADLMEFRLQLIDQTYFETLRRMPAPQQEKFFKKKPETECKKVIGFNGYFVCQEPPL